MERENGLARTTPEGEELVHSEHGGANDERFRRASRLRSSADFQRVRRSGKRRQGTFLTLNFTRTLRAEGVEPAPTRVGFSVSKRVGDAVTRNRVKRRLREAVRRRLWQVTPGWDMILTARPEAANADYMALRDDVEALLSQARVLRPASGARVTRGETGEA